MTRVPSIKGYGANPRRIESHSLGHARTLKSMANRYFGIDLGRLPEMSDQELAQFADRAIAMKRLRSVLPILEKHFTELIQGQAEYESFIQRTLKEVEKSGKKIDKAVLDAWLLNRGYDQHLKLMNQKAGLEANKQEAEFRSEFDLNQLDFQSALKIIHLRHQHQARQIQGRYPQTVRQLETREKQRLEAEQRKELLTYGTAGRPGKGVWARGGSFFGL